MIYLALIFGAGCMLLPVYYVLRDLIARHFAQ